MKCKKMFSNKQISKTIIHSMIKKKENFIEWYRVKMQKKGIII